MTSKKKDNLSWSGIKKSLANFDSQELVKLISDLYRLSKDNQDFLHARFPIGNDRIGAYKRIIQECMYPDVLKNKPLRISRAKQAIRNYAKAAGDAKGEAELMTCFVECGNNFTLEYGDIDEDFYDALLWMYKQAINKVLSLPEPDQNEFRERLKKIMLSSEGIGWGYHDGLGDEFYEAFSEDE